MSSSHEHDAFMKLSDVLAERDYNGIPPSPKTPKTIFICGAPRSGTTILYQALSYCTNVGYINNLIARFSAYPPIGIYLNQAINLPKVFTGKSNFGATTQLTEPHEFGAFWLSAFALQDLRQPIDISNADIIAGIHRISGIVEAFQRPVLFKSFAYLWFITEIANILQNSLWIHISRNTDKNAKSLFNLYNNRANEKGVIPIWTSAIASKTLQSMPFPSLEEQSIAQIHDINEHISEQLSNLPSERHYHLSLENFLDCPSKEISELANFMKAEVSQQKINEVTASLTTTL